MTDKTAASETSDAPETPGASESPEPSETDDDDPGPPLTYRQERAVEAAMRRRRKFERWEVLLEHLASGMSQAELANTLCISRNTLKREIDRAMELRRLESPAQHVEMQVRRLEKAMRVISSALDRGELAATKPLLQVMDRLDRYQGLVARLSAATTATAALPAPAAAPLALPGVAAAPLEGAPTESEASTFVHASP